jgi:hypothetical protein
MLPIAGEFGVAVCDGAFEVAHIETQFRWLRRFCAGKQRASIKVHRRCVVEAAGSRGSFFRLARQKMSR